MNKKLLVLGITFIILLIGIVYLSPTGIIPDSWVLAREFMIVLLILVALLMFHAKD